MKKTIEILQNSKVKKEDILSIQEQVFNNDNYFEVYDINSLSQGQSNLLHFAMSYKMTDFIEKLLDKNIDVFKKNKVGMYPVFFAKSIKDVNVLLNHHNIKYDTEKFNKLRNLLCNDIISPLYYWKKPEFNEFLEQNKDLLSTINDYSVTFILNLHQLFDIDLHKCWHDFKLKHNIEFKNSDIYLYIINKVKDNKNNNFSMQALTQSENARLKDFIDYKNHALSLIHSIVDNPESVEKTQKIYMHHYSDFYLSMTSEYEQANFLKQEYDLIKDSIQKGKITYFEENYFLDNLLYQWQDYLNQGQVIELQLKEICETYGLAGINISPVFSIKFIKKILNDLQKETCKVFRIKDKQLFANNAYLKITNIFESSHGYLSFSSDKNILNINIEDYSPAIENVFTDEMKTLKSCFVHEYTHFLQVVSESYFKLDFKTNKTWLKIEQVLLNEPTDKSNIEDKIYSFIIEECNKNNFEFKHTDQLNNYLKQVKHIVDEKEIKPLANKILLLCPKDQQTLAHRKYMISNLYFIHQCLNEKNKNLQKMYFEKRNKDEKMKNYYDSPIELHARMNEHLLKIKCQELIKDFNFLSEEDNIIYKKRVMKDLRKFNKLILNQFEKLKQQNNHKLKK